MRPTTDGGFRRVSHQGLTSVMEGSVVANRPTSTDAYRPSSGRRIDAPEEVELSVGSARASSPFRPSSGSHQSVVDPLAEEPSAIARISTAGGFKGSSAGSHQGSGTVAEVLAATERPESGGSPLAAPKRNTNQGLILGAHGSSAGAMHSSQGGRPSSVSGVPGMQGSRPGYGAGAVAPAPVGAGSAAGSRRTSHLGGSAAAGTGPAAHSIDVPVLEAHAEGADGAELQAIGSEYQEGAAVPPGQAQQAEGEGVRVEGGRESPRLSHESPVRQSHLESAKEAWGE